MEVLGSILSADFAHLQKDVDALRDASIDGIHLDVMDGQFVPNISFGLPVIDKIKSDLPLDFHLMVRNPEIFVSHLANEESPYKRSNFKHSVTLHVESSAQIDDDLELLKAFGYSPRVAINPSTLVAAIEPFLDIIDGVLIMSVNPGYSGQAFIEGVLNKAKVLKEMKPSLKIGIDGGVNDKSIKLIRQAPIDYVISASYLFNAKDMSLAVDSLR